MKKCVDLNQVRYYGVKKVDPKLLETLDKTIKLSRGLLFSKIMKIKGQIKNLKNKRFVQHFTEKIFGILIRH